MIWMVWKPRDSDQAKIGLASGQPGSDTKVVGAGFPGHKFPASDPYVTTRPRITVAGGHFLDIGFQQLQGFEYKTL